MRQKNELSALFGSKLLNVILYGLYARGDFDSESDIDVMALIDIDKIELQKYRRTVSALANEIDLRYNVLLSIKLQDNESFIKYQNVIKEGVTVGIQ